MSRIAAYTAAAAMFVLFGSTLSAAASPITAYGVNFLPTDFALETRNFAPREAEKAEKRLSGRIRKDDKRTAPELSAKEHKSDTLRAQ